MRAIHTIHIYDVASGELMSFYQARTGHRLTPEEEARWAVLEEDNFIDACRRERAAWVAKQAQEQARLADAFIAAIDSDAI
ncbi:MAG: hypothetical protein ACYCSN_12395 [Acidobacteriaceae bacterium]|nr:hypothetical protein [Thiomonas sp.]